MPFKRNKNAQAKLEDALQTYYRNYGACEQLAESLKEKLAERSYASLEAISTLGHVATFMRQIPISNQGKQDTFDDVGPDQTSDWQNRSKTADDLLKTLSSFGAGAAGVAALWAAAGFGTASGLSGAALITSKLAALGGGAIAAGGGGMLLGAAVFGGVPVAIGVVTFSIMSSIRAKKRADEALKKIAAAECELTRWRERTNLTILRLNELTGAEESLTHTLQQLLVQCSPGNPSDVRTMASISGVLAQVVDIPIADEDGNLLNEDGLKDVYRKHVLGARQGELFQAYRRMRVAVAIREHDRAVSAAKHILSVITL